MSERGEYAAIPFRVSRGLHAGAPCVLLSFDGYATKVGEAPSVEGVLEYVPEEDAKGLPRRSANGEVIYRPVVKGAKLSGGRSLAIAHEIPLEEGERLAWADRERVLAYRALELVGQFRELEASVAALEKRAEAAEARAAELAGENATLRGQVTHYKSKKG